MRFVIDANVLFSALVKEGLTSDLLFIDELHFYAPEYLFEEFQKYKNVILDKTTRTMDDFERILRLLEGRIVIIPFEEFEGYYDEAERITPDKKDVPYLALALFLKIPIWSNDKPLRNQRAVKVISTSELLGLLSNQ